MPRLHVCKSRELAIELDHGQRSLDLRTGQRLHDPSDLDPALSVVAVAAGN